MAEADLAYFPGGPTDLTFPEDLPQYKYHVTFDFRKFTRRSLEDRAFYAAMGNLRLPIPANLVDTQQARWGAAEAGPVIGTVQEIFVKNQGTLGNLGDSVKAAAAGNLDELRNTLTQIGAGTANATVEIGRAQIAAALRFIQGSSVTGIWGKTINPFMTVLYQAPVFKSHSFQWKLSPANPHETEVIKNIVAKFRYHMLPKFTDGAGGLLLDYPDMVYVALYPADIYLYKFKPCVITDLQVNFAPSGPSFYRGTQAPTEVVLTVQLLEIEFWIKDDVVETWNNSTPEVPPAP